MIHLPENLKKILMLPLVIFLILSLASCAGVVSASTGTATPSSTITSAPGSVIPPEITQFAKDWPLPNKDYANTRATMGSGINSSNVNTLGAAWAVPLPGQGIFGSASTMPIIMGDTIYVQDLGNNVFAIDMATGNIKWKVLFNNSNIGPNGIAVGWGKVFGSLDPYNIVALDADTGSQLWRTQITNQPTTGVDIQPSVYNNMVYISTVPGTSGGDFYTGGGIGTIYALDQSTGKIVWSFDTVDTPELWGNKDVNSGGGSWYSPAIDTDTGMTYWGVGNPAPFPGTKDFPSGSSRPGPNLYTDSMLALDSQNGTLAWYTQVRAHDLFDLDFQIPPVLASASVNGTQQDIVIGAGKLGKVVAFNRQTGDILWETNVGQHDNDDLTSIPDTGNATRVYPGFFGGVETPMAYANGVIYVPVVNLYADYTPSTATPQPFNQGTGELVAIDVNTGKILWDNKLNSLCFGGATVVNDLVFTSTFDGMMYAFKADTGAQVWSWQAPGPVNAWPSAAGDTLLVPVGQASPFAVLIALKLGATAPAVAILPLDGQSVVSGNITVSAMALNLKLVDQLGDVNVPGEGHLHYFMDVDAPTAQGKPAVPSTGAYAATANTTHIFTNVAPENIPSP